jgi:hypothetical protein
MPIYPCLVFRCISQRYFDLRNEVRGVWINYVVRGFMKLPKYYGGAEIKGDEIGINCGAYVVE